MQNTRSVWEVLFSHVREAVVLSLEEEHSGKSDILVAIQLWQMMVLIVFLSMGALQNCTAN